jgi:hypothetical protein
MITALEAAGERIGLSPNRLRYYDSVQDLEYEGAIEWDPSARYARGLWLSSRSRADKARLATRELCLRTRPLYSSR